MLDLYLWSSRVATSGLETSSVAEYGAPLLHHDDGLQVSICLWVTSRQDKRCAFSSECGCED